MAIEGKIVIELKQDPKTSEQEKKYITIEGSDFKVVGKPKLQSTPKFKEDSTEYTQLYRSEKGEIAVDIATTISVDLSGTTEDNIRIVGNTDLYKVEENSLIYKEVEEKYTIIEEEEED